MKNRWMTVAACAILLAVVFGCGPSKTELKKQEVAQRDLGSQYYLAGNYSAALKHLLQAEEYYADDPFLQNYLGLTYLAKDQTDLALEHFQRALKLKPDYAPAKNNMGAVYMKKKDWDAAIKIYTELTADLVYATPHFPFTNLGNAYYHKKQYTLSEKNYLEALRIEPAYWPALKGLGRTYVAMRKGEQAVAALTSVAENVPEDAETQFFLARAYLLIKNYKKAKQAYQRVLRLAPDSEWAPEAQKMLQHLRNVR
jgi:tetratricopeptide (TPR) repeat protein